MIVVIRIKLCEIVSLSQSRVGKNVDWQVDHIETVCLRLESNWRTISGLEIGKEYRQFHRKGREERGKRKKMESL